MLFPGWLKERFLQLPFFGKFGRDVSWNYLSLGVLGLCGILMNVGIARFYGAATLGIFNIVFSMYIILSQFAVWGIHLSVQKHVAQFAGDRKETGAIISSGVALTAVAAALVCAAVFALRKLIGSVFHNPDVSMGLLCVLPGLFCFAMNKVLLSVVNGYRRMKAFAFFQALRYVLILILLGTAIITGLPGLFLPAIFSGAELGLLLCLFFYARSLYTHLLPSNWSGWVARHFAFGSRALVGGVLIDANTKVDVLMLGYFCSDKIVGIYSLAAILIEGFSQLAVVIRVNVNPILARLAGEFRLAQLRAAVRRIVKTFYLLMVIIGITAIIVYPVFLWSLVQREVFAASWPVFTILMAGLMIGAGYKPFDMLLVQLGRPGLHTWYIALVAVSNAVLNAIMIPLIGMYGAATATGVAFVLSMIYLKLFVWRAAHIRI